MELLDRRDPSQPMLEGGGPRTVSPATPRAAVPEAALDASAPAGVCAYEELDGAHGRSVFFRPHRHTAQELEPLRSTVTVTVGGASRECPMQDVSQNGVAFAWPEGLPVELRQTLQIALRFNTHEAFAGEAVVGSMRVQDGTVVVGVSFHEFLLDVEEILQLRSVFCWAARAEEARSQTRPWQFQGGERFKSLVSELRLLCEDGRTHLAEIEKELPWHVLNGPPNPACATLKARIRTDLLEDVIGLTEQIDAAVRVLPGGHRNPAAQAFSRRYLDDLFLTSPNMRRARFKPLGYPGDYQLMSFLYACGFEGSDLFGRSIGYAFAHCRGSLAVRCRKDLVKRQIKALLEERAGTGMPVRVLSVAAGPAQELYELLNELEELPAELEIVLFEQDKNALAHAWRRLKETVDRRFPGRVRLVFLHESIKRFLRDADMFAGMGKFDLIYCCGMYDYLAQRTAVVLTRHMAKSLAPRGKLLVANMVDNAARWLLEHHMEWYLIYRSREELLDIGRRAVPGAQVRILEEESGVNPFFELVRDA